MASRAVATAEAAAMPPMDHSPLIRLLMTLSAPLSFFLLCAAFRTCNACGTEVRTGGA